MSFWKTRAVVFLAMKPSATRVLKFGIKTFLQTPSDGKNPSPPLTLGQSLTEIIFNLKLVLVTLPAEWTWRKLTRTLHWGSLSAAV